MMNRIFLILISLLTFIGLANGDLYNCNSCDDCNTKIKSASFGDRIQLIADIEDYDGTCIRFENAKNVTFDCQGHIIDGNDLGSYHGIYLGGETYGIVRNFIVTDFSHGIYLYKSRNITIVNNTLRSNRFGIYLRDSFYNLIIDNTANNNRHGLYLRDSSHNLLVNNTANSNGYYGIFLVDSFGNTMNRNRACYNSVNDIYQGYGDNSGIENTCNTTWGWNDKESIGCSYSCEKVSQRVTTTTIITVTTTTAIKEIKEIDKDATKDIEGLKWWQKLWNSLLKILGWILSAKF